MTPDRVTALSCWNCTRLDGTTSCTRLDGTTSWRTLTSVASGTSSPEAVAIW